MWNFSSATRSSFFVLFSKAVFRLRRTCLNHIKRGAVLRKTVVYTSIAARVQQVCGIIMVRPCFRDDGALRLTIRVALYLAHTQTGTYMRSRRSALNNTTLTYTYRAPSHQVKVWQGMGTCSHKRLRDAKINGPKSAPSPPLKRVEPCPPRPTVAAVTVLLCFFAVLFSAAELVLRGQRRTIFLVWTNTTVEVYLFLAILLSELLGFLTQNRRK